MTANAAHELEGSDWFFVSGDVKIRARLLNQVEDVATGPTIAMWKSSFVQQRKHGLELFLEYTNQTYHPELHATECVGQLFVFEYADKPSGATPLGMAFWQISEEPELGRVVYVPYVAVSPELEHQTFESDVFAAVTDHILDELKAYAMVWEFKKGQMKHHDPSHYRRTSLRYAQELSGVRHAVPLGTDKEMPAVIMLQSDHVLTPDMAYRAASKAIGHELEIVGELGLT